MIPKTLTAASTKLITSGHLTAEQQLWVPDLQKNQGTLGRPNGYSEGMLYPVFHNLEKEKLIESAWTMEQIAKAARENPVHSLRQE